MNDQFPLGNTSTIYMSGQRLYSIIQYQKPGFRKTVALLPDEAQEIREVVTDAIEEAEQRGAEDMLAFIIKNCPAYRTAEEVKDWMQHRLDLHRADRIGLSDR